jgi:hypothetical protein
LRVSDLAGLVMKDTRQTMITADHYTESEHKWKKELAKKLMDVRE